MIELDDGITSSAAVVNASFCEQFLRTSAEAFKRKLASAANDTTEETKQLMLQFQSLHGVFDTRRLTPDEEANAKNNPKLMILGFADSITMQLLLANARNSKTNC